MAFNLSKTIHQIPSEIKQDHLSKNYLHVVSSGKLDEKAEAERFNLIKSMGRRGTPNAVKNKWAPIQEQTTKDILNQSSSVDPNSLKARQSLEAFEARKKIFAEKQARENQIKLEKEKEMNKLREQRRMQRRSLYESDSSWRHGNSVSSGFDNNLDSKKVEINSMADKKNITDKGFERSHSVIDTISKLREKTTPDRFDKPVESFSYKNEKSITSATRADNQAITSHSISGSLTENRNRSSLSYKNKFNMFENNKDSYTGLKNLRNSSVNENYESPFKHRYSSGKSNNSCKSNVSNLRLGRWKDNDFWESQVLRSYLHVDHDLFP